MSWALHLSADGVADLRRLEPWLQEEVLDELERLLTNPHLIPPPLPDWGSVHLFARASGSSLHVVSLTLEGNDLRQVLTVLGVQSLSSS